MENDVTDQHWVRQYHLYVDNTADGRARAESRRDYYDGKQWTEDEAQVLRNRGQAPVVKNRIGPKIDFLIGLEQQARTDPRAMPRTPQHSDGAEALTDALRYVEENNELDETFSTVFGELCVEGIEAVDVVIRQTRRSTEIAIEPAHWDRFYYDPHSREHDFSDARYLGMTAWLSLAEAKRLFKDRAEDIEQRLGEHSTGTQDAHADRPNQWIDTKDQRIRVNKHFFRDEDDEWSIVYFSGDLTLMEPRKSPYLDDEGAPACTIIAQSAYVDRENDRYGLVERLMSVQDEINHRSSKALHMLSSNRLWATSEGLFPQGIHAALNELQKGKGALIANGQRGRDWDLIDNAEYAQGQLVMLQDAKNEIDAIGANAALTGKDDRSLSGRALEQRRESGVTEVGPTLNAHRAFKRRVYRAIAERVRQFWTEERWVRVTDDERNARFAVLNQPVRRAEILQAQGIEVFNPEAPEMQEVVEIRNNVEELDVDITIEAAPDTISIQAEQFELVAQLAQGRPELFELVIELSSLRNKDKILEKLKGGEENQAIAMAQQVALAGQEAKIQRDKAAAIKDVAQATKIQKEAGHAPAQGEVAEAADPLLQFKLRQEEAKAEKAEVEAEKAALELMGMAGGAR